MKDSNERRAMLAIVLCLIVYFVWAAFFGPKPPVEVDAASAETPAAMPVAAAPEIPSIAPVPSAPCVGEAVTLGTSTQLRVDTCTGNIVSLQLEDYQEAVTVTPWWTWVWGRVTGTTDGGWVAYGGEDGVMSLLGEGGDFLAAGRGPLTSGGSYTVVSREPLTLQHVGPDGLTITKTFTPTASADLFDVKVQFSATVPLNGPFWVGFSDDFAPLTGTYDMRAHPTALVDGDLEKLTTFDVAGGNSMLEGPVSWLGIENRYFLAGFAPADPAWGRLVWAPVTTGYGGFLVNADASLAPGKPIDLAFTVYAGPKNVERLADIGLGFEDAADLGIWGFFSKILLFFLHVFHAGLKNWGLSILSLTFFIRLSFYPLSARAFKSGKAMQAIQPLLKELQEKYKDDKEAQTRETMALFSKNNVNPLGGCLPLLLQMPVFFALYSALLSTPDLFQADFLYIHDLSSPDPFGALPAIMAVGMVLQQRLTPMTGMDPAQAQMMRFMPLVFALFMFGLPAGLSLYYALNTALSILQQWYNTRSYQPLLPSA